MTTDLRLHDALNEVVEKCGDGVFAAISDHLGRLHRQISDLEKEIDYLEESGLRSRRKFRVWDDDRE